MKLMCRDVKISNQWFVSLESSVKWKLWVFVPSGLMFFVLLLFVEGSVLPGLGVYRTYWGTNKHLDPTTQSRQQIVRAHTSTLRSQIPTVSV
jgi:hypothetical protein